MAEVTTGAEACDECRKEAAARKDGATRPDCRFCVQDYQRSLAGEREAREKAEAHCTDYRRELQRLRQIRAHFLLESASAADERGQAAKRDAFLDYLQGCIDVLRPEGYKSPAQTEMVALEATVAAYREALKDLIGATDHNPDRAIQDANDRASEVWSSPDPAQAVAERLEAAARLARETGAFTDWLKAKLAEARSSRTRQMAEVEDTQRPFMRGLLGQGGGHFWALRGSVTDAATCMHVYGLESTAVATERMEAALAAYDKSVRP